MNLNGPDPHTLCDVDIVGVAVKGSLLRDGGLQTHIALIYKYGGEPVSLVHFGGHKRFMVHEPSSEDQYYWLDLGEYFSAMDKEIISAHIRKVVENNSEDSISYGFDSSGEYFNPETGKFMPTSKAVGLTCSTFVLEVFSSCAYPLIDLLSWPSRLKEDIKWQERTLSKLMRIDGVNQELLVRQTKNVGNRRFLPEEVFVSTQEDVLPTVRGKVKEKAKIVRKHIKSNL
ncbi:MAG: hypothetical protein COA29_02460 [Porticoccus sp.]|nr:MAG: hypothetical protein COA29_02460 [Porticoccus sp.]